MIIRLPILVKIPLKYALVASLLAIAVITMMYFSNHHPLLIPILYDYRILLFGVFIFFTLKEFRDYHNQSILHFWQGLISGIIFYIALAMIVAVFIYVFGRYETSFVTQYIEGTVRGLEINKEEFINRGKITISEEEFKRQIDLLKETKSYQLAFDYFIKSCLIGFFLSLLISIILRRTEIRT